MVVYRDVSNTLVASTSTSTSRPTLLSCKNTVSASTSVIASHASIVFLAQNKTKRLKLN